MLSLEPWSICLKHWLVTSCAKCEYTQEDTDAPEWAASTGTLVCQSPVSLKQEQKPIYSIEIFGVVAIDGVEDIGAQLHKQSIATNEDSNELSDRHRNADGARK